MNTSWNPSLQPLQQPALRGPSGLEATSGAPLRLLSGSWGQDSFQPSATAQAGAEGPDVRSAALSIFREGVARDLAGQNQEQALTSLLNGLTPGQLTTLGDLLSQATNKTAQIFTLKAIVAGEPWDNVVQYAQEMRGFSEQEIIERSTMRGDADVVQQWQDSCGPTLMQTMAGEADPRFAWELNKAGDLARIDPLGAAKLVADQQKQWLERYGGAAVQRGQSGGQGMALNQILDDMMGPLTGASYQTQEVSNSTLAFDQIAQNVQAGYDVPIRISWNRPGDSQDNGHFVLALAVRGAPGSREFQVHDPWTGKTDWISERSIAQDSFGPIFNQYARMSHVYTAQPASSFA